MMKQIVIASVVIFLLSSIAFAANVKEADLAGSWYPASKGELAALIDSYLNAAHPAKFDGPPLAIISPHAGYQYSGPIAAYGYKALEGKDIKTVVLVGFSHRLPFDGISIYDNGSFRTPLGEIAIDEELAAAIEARNKRIFFYPQAFRGENSVEMQVPFIQTVFKSAKVVPIAFGTQDYGDAVILADALAAVLKDRSDCLIVASTDLSHYHPYDRANSIDKHTITTLEKMKGKEFYGEASIGLSELCGAMPVTVVLLAAEKLGYTNIKVLKYANSGDTAGDKAKVVGYVSAVVYKEVRVTSDPKPLASLGFGAGERRATKVGGKQMLSNAQRKRLLQIARESFTGFVRDGKKKSFTEKDPLLNENMGAFVTLKEGGELRGCIGNMVGTGPLYQTVAGMAIEAATGDPRFAPLTPGEIDKVDVEISVLSPLKKVASADEIRIPGQGVIVKRGYRSGVYLPQVATEAGWNKEQFLTSLCAHKAGLEPDAWKDPRTEMFVFEAEVFGEKENSQ